MKNDYCVIMAGGVGTRFWPMSKTAHPKQFIDILGTGESLLQQTYNRFLKVCGKDNIFIVTNQQYLSLVKKQLPTIAGDRILLEPARRNTAPCIAYAAYKISSIDPDANLIVAPSDHIILREDAFIETLKAGLEATRANNWLLTLGIRPNRPDTGYGYIQYDVNEAWEKNDKIFKVITFTEKPELEMAKSFLASGDFLWNSGIFLWSLKSILDAFAEHLPDVNNIFREGIGSFNTPGEAKFIKDAYTICKSISIDYGVMEKAENVHVLASDFGWSDLGTWGSLYDTRDKNEDGNTIDGNNVMMYDSSNCIVHMPKNKLCVIQGLDDYIVVEDDDILLICRKSEEQQIRQFVNDVKVEKGDKYI